VKKRLADLEPGISGTVADGIIFFDCPVCEGAAAHRVGVLISAQPFHERPRKEGELYKVWQASGAFPDSLTLSPSIDLVEVDENGNKIRTRCWHGFIQNGDVT
jgi:hypothetical protein